MEAHLPKLFLFVKLANLKLLVYVKRYNSFHQGSRMYIYRGCGDDDDHGVHDGVHDVHHGDDLR
jgi:hypothetical protein